MGVHNWRDVWCAHREILLRLARGIVLMETVKAFICIVVVVLVVIAAFSDPHGTD